MRCVGRGGLGAGGAGQVHRDRLHHRYHPAVGRVDDVHLPADRSGIGDGLHPVRRLGRHRHPELGAGGGSSADLPAHGYRNVEGRRDFQHHPRPIPADHRDLAGGVVRTARDHRRARERRASDLREVPDVRARFHPALRAFDHRHLRPGAALQRQVLRQYQREAAHDRRNESAGVGARQDPARRPESGG